MSFEGILGCCDCEPVEPPPVDCSPCVLPGGALLADYHYSSFYLTIPPYEATRGLTYYNKQLLYIWNEGNKIADEFWWTGWEEYPDAPQFPNGHKKRHGLLLWCASDGRVINMAVQIWDYDPFGDNPNYDIDPVHDAGDYWVAEVANPNGGLHVEPGYSCDPVDLTFNQGAVYPNPDDLYATITEV